MKKVCFVFLLALMCIPAMAQNHKLWYAKPASHWLEALPVGNSHLGAMVYGGTDTEEIQLNEETFWSGSPHDNNSHESLAAAFGKPETFPGAQKRKSIRAGAEPERCHCYHLL